MAKNQTVWGIDIGNTSLKALRCTLAEGAGTEGTGAEGTRKIEALACDFIEHSKVLSLPGTDVPEVMAETLQMFLSRNTTQGDRVAISVSGQNTISRFLPLPPVDPKKIPDVIRYEAKQWLPFDINDVVFDFQPLAKPARESEDDEDDDGFDDTTVGMFAIKKDVAMKALSPYLSQSVDIDSIQSSPIALYNFMAFDQLSPPVARAADNDTPPESLIALCIGTDASDVVITNGETVWIRNIPLGGNAFTKALTRELQLTFSKAEYLKRNITTSKDVNEQKRVIMAMRPVFNDMVNEVNRSLEYYQTLNRKARFQKIIALGNAAKLPGLRQFVAQNLGYEVVRLSRFNNLVGAEVIDTQLFRDNLHSFSVCYGLAVQQLGLSSLRTNLIPREVIFDRIIREKKPWMLAAAAALLLGVTIQFMGVSSAFSRVSSQLYKDASSRAESVQSFASGLKSQTSAAVSAFNNIDEIGKSLTSNVEGRITWLELLRAINVALPQSRPGANTVPSPPSSESFAQIDRVFIESIEAITVDSLTTWFAPLKADQRYWLDFDDAEAQAHLATLPLPPPSEEGEELTDEEIAAFRKSEWDKMSEAERFALVAGPAGTGPAKVVQISGSHFHNPTDPDAFRENGGQAYLRQSLLRNLKNVEVDLPPTLAEQRAGTPTKTVTTGELGISYPVLLYVPSIVTERIINPALHPLDNITIDPQFQQQLGQTGGGGGAGMMPRGGAVGGGQGGMTLSQRARDRGVPPQDIILTVRRFDFVIQFAWEETPPSQRLREENGEYSTGSTGTE